MLVVKSSQLHALKDARSNLQNTRVVWRADGNAEVEAADVSQPSKFAEDEVWLKLKGIL